MTAVRIVLASGLGLQKPCSLDNTHRGLVAVTGGHHKIKQCEHTRDLFDLISSLHLTFLIWPDTSTLQSTTSTSSMIILQRCTDRRTFTHFQWFPFSPIRARSFEIQLCKSQLRSRTYQHSASLLFFPSASLVCL